MPNLSMKNAIIFIGIMLIGFSTWFYISYTQPIAIHSQYQGIKFRNADNSVTEPVKIEIDGKYMRSLLGNADVFVGNIKLNNKVVADANLSTKFNKEKFAPLSAGMLNHGIIFIDDQFKKITIQQDGGEGKYWWIAAPCSTRAEAVEVTNGMVSKLGFSLK